MSIRNSTKALIVKDGKLLALKMLENGETYYILPGGGQKHGETLHQALERECLEEIGAEVEIGELLFVREYIGQNHELAAYHSHAHQIEFMFLCKGNTETFSEGTHLDKGHIGTVWLPIQELMEYNLFPRALRTHIISYCDNGSSPIYLGDIN